MKIFTIVLGLLISPVLALAHGGDHDMMDQGAAACSMMGGNWGMFGMGLHFILWILFVAITVFVVRKVWVLAAPKNSKK